MILPIYLYGQPILRRPTEEIDLSTPQTQAEITQLISDMFETLKAADGCGLAAPQVGRSLRLFIVDGSELGEEYPDCATFKKAFINPKLIETSNQTTTCSEGCLSLPGISENVVRPQTITISYLDEHFQPHTDILTDFQARIVLHEFDHLEAHLFTDRISLLRKQLVRNKLNNIEKGKVVSRYKYKK